MFSIRRRSVRIALRIVVLVTFAQVVFHTQQLQSAQAVVSADPSLEIVYIDDLGVIRVIDPQGEPNVQWASPTGGWENVALGDVNADGDMEILAIGGTAGQIQVAVFDPVIASGALDPNKEINGIPWDTLFELTLFGNPDLIAAGDFDANIPGDEMLVGYKFDGSRSRIVIYKAGTLQQNGLPSGRDWVEHIVREYDFEYGSVAVGNVNGRGAEDVILIGNTLVDGEPESFFDVYEPADGFARIDGKTTSQGSYQDIETGQVIDGGTDEVAVARSNNAGSESWLVYETNEDEELESDAEGFNVPNPHTVILADINGNGDKEVFLLRDNQDDLVRLFIVNEWGNDQDSLPDIQLSLDEDNGYESGAGGDIDGDGRDEILLVRNDRIRAYMEPERSVENNTIIDYFVPTGEGTVLVGDLDRTGFIEGPQFGTDVTSIEATTPTGTRSRTYSVRLENLSTNEPASFFIVQNFPSWMEVSPLFGQTPANLTVTFDATDLAPGTYTSGFTIDSNEDVVNAPYRIDVSLLVEEAALAVQPANFNFTYFPCERPYTDESAQRSMTVQIAGTRGLRYQATLIEVPVVDATQTDLSAIVSGAMVDENGNMQIYDGAGNTTQVDTAAISAAATDGAQTDWPESISWISEVKSLTNTVPSTMTIQVDPTALGESFEVAAAALVLVADTRAGMPPDNVEVIPVVMLCAEEQVALPHVSR